MFEFADGNHTGRCGGAPGAGLPPPECRPRPPFERIALALQGGGALGAYQGGVYQALAEADLHPDWVAGISIGAINAAIIAGNPPAVARRQASRVLGARERPSDAVAGPFRPCSRWRRNGGNPPDIRPLLKGDVARSLLNQWSATSALWWGAPGFFTPRAVSPWLFPDGSMEATSYYDTRSLEQTLERLVDFDRINDGPMRLSVGAVNVRTGDFVYFDTTTHRIGPRHIMASGALPPGFPAVEIDGEHYWDGGLVSNTPLGWMVDAGPPKDTLVFQVDLWSAARPVPAQHGARGDAAEGDPVLQPHPRRVRTASRSCSASRTRWRSCLPGCRPSWPTARKRRAAQPLRAQGREPDPAHLPLQGLRGRFQGLRVLAPEHRGALARGLPRHRAHAPASRGAERPSAPDGVFIFDVAQHGRE